MHTTPCRLARSGRTRLAPKRQLAPSHAACARPKPLPVKQLAPAAREGRRDARVKVGLPPMPHELPDGGGDSYCWCDLTCSVLRPAASGSSSHRLAPSRPAAPPLACGGAARGELGRWASTGGRRPAACEAAAHLTAAGRRSDSA